MTSQNRCSVHFTNIEERVNRDILLAACSTFGEVRSVDIPLDIQSGVHRGFGFVEFFEASDAADAADNLNQSELFGRVLKASIAKEPMRQLADPRKPVWADELFLRKREALG